MKKLVLLITILGSVHIYAQEIKLEYPYTKKVDHVDDYFGNKVPDPYRWLEDTKSKEVVEWIEAQNALTQSYFRKIPFYDKIEARYKEIWDYEKYSAPSKVGDYYFFYKNDGLQEQSVLYFQKGLTGEPDVFLDPNTFSEDGTVSLSSLSFSNDNKYCGYGISRGGSDWQEFYIIDIESRKQLEDKIEWVKFSGMSWYKDGFFYSRYDEPKGEDKLKAKNEFHKVYYHKLGTAQSEDKLIFQSAENPLRNFYAQTTDDDKHLIIYASQGASSKNMFYYKNLENNGDFIQIIPSFENSYSVYDVIDGKLLVVTDRNAPNERVVLIDPKLPEEKNWKELIPENKYPINFISYVGGKLLVSYLEDAFTKVYIFSLKGEKLGEVKLPGIGVASGFGGKPADNEVFYVFSSFTTPPTIYKYDVEKNESFLFRQPVMKFDVSQFETEQVFYKSKDGTRIPLFLVYKKGMVRDGNNPVLLYGYGGFNAAMTPSFRLGIIPVLENGGIYALACIRGGSEYGEEWHKAGMREKKQNVFDDFIAAAEYLIKENYTSPSKLAIWGGSNGGLLVGACMLQRPDLFKVAIPEVGVLDMLRFHKFTIGWAWVPEYGSSEDKEQFEYLIKYSPLHNIVNGRKYPATIISTADHDDRVFPAHSYKFAAALQSAQAGSNPILLSVETKAGHGAGMSTSKVIKSYAENISFMFYNMNVEIK